MEEKLNRLVTVTSDHLLYVNYYLTEESQSRVDWEYKRFKLLKISFYILNGINQLIEKVKVTDFYEKFVHTKRNILHILSTNSSHGYK